MHDRCYICLSIRVLSNTGFIPIRAHHCWHYICPRKAVWDPTPGQGGGAIGEAPARIGSTPQGSLNIPRWVVLGSPHKSEIFGGTGFFLVDIFRGGELNMGDYKKKGVKILVGEKH
jgi:hypothetical protein